MKGIYYDDLLDRRTFFIIPAPQFVFWMERSIICNVTKKLIIHQISYIFCATTFVRKHPRTILKVSESNITL